MVKEKKIQDHGQYICSEYSSLFLYSVLKDYAQSVKTTFDRRESLEEIVPFLKVLGDQISEDMNPRKLDKLFESHLKDTGMTKLSYSPGNQNYFVR